LTPAIENLVTSSYADGRDSNGEAQRLFEDLKLPEVSGQTPKQMDGATNAKLINIIVN
jgi:hypothetical protein